MVSVACPFHQLMKECGRISHWSVTTKRTVWRMQTLFGTESSVSPLKLIPFVVTAGHFLFPFPCMYPSTQTVPWGAVLIAQYLRTYPRMSPWTQVGAILTTLYRHRYPVEVQYVYVYTLGADTGILLRCSADSTILPYVLTDTGIQLRCSADSTILPYVLTDTGIQLRCSADSTILPYVLTDTGIQLRCSADNTIPSYTPTDTGILLRCSTDNTIPSYGHRCPVLYPHMYIRTRGHRYPDEVMYSGDLWSKWLHTGRDEK